MTLEMQGHNTDFQSAMTPSVNVRAEIGIVSRYFYFAVALFVGCSAFADTPSLTVPPSALTTIRHLPIQHQGRTKPFESVARETLRRLTGHERWGRQDPVETVLSIMSRPERWQAEPLIAVPFLPLREALGLDRHQSRVSYDELIATRRLMRMLPAIVAKQAQDEQLTMLEQETLDAFERFVAFSQLIEHRMAVLPPPDDGDRVWRSILELEGYAVPEQGRVRRAWAEWMGALRDGPPATIEAATSAWAATVRELRPSALPASWRLTWEAGYHRAAPFRAAQVGYGLAVLGLWLAGSGRRRRLARPFGSLSAWALWLGITCHAAGIVSRVVLGGRPPVSNFYETMLWLPFVALILALVLDRFYGARIFRAAALLSLIMLWLSDQVPLDPSISPVVAVLRSNLWLTIHVLTIVASYGALALATVLAHGYALAWLRHGTSRESLRRLDLFLYRAIQVGVVLLAGGIMLGAVWANASWGRYWGWDPKETWALITLLWYLAALHGRLMGWLRGVGLALATIGGFFLLLMTYYGVSFYLVGLHSYAGGHATPLPPLLVAYLVGEGLFMGWIAYRALSRGRRTAPSPRSSSTRSSSS